MKINGKSDKFKKESDNLKQFEVTTKIAKLADQSFVSSAQLNDIIEGLCAGGSEFDITGRDRSAAIFAITQLMELIRRLPIKFFREVDNRMQILGAMQAELDELIVIEEQEENEDMGNDVLEEDDEIGQTCSVENIVKNA